MIGESTLLMMMRRILWLVATGLGGIGVASVWGSFHSPDLAIEAFMTLPVATFIILAMPPAPPPDRRPPRLRASATFGGKLREFVAACRPRSRSR